MTGLRRSLRSSLSLMVLTACGGATQPIVPFATRDSAGVEIIESGSALWDSTAAWTVDTVPILSIGKADGEDPYLFSWIADAFRRDDGSIVIVDRASHDFRAFDSTGVFIVARGRKGQGPAEFGRIEYASRCGADAIWVQGGNRLSVWGTDLTYRREFTYTDDQMWPLICFGGSALLVKEDVHRPGEDPVGTLYDDSLHLRVLDSLGRARRELLTIRMWSYINLRTDRGGLGFPHPFGGQSLLGQDSAHLILGAGDALSFRTYAADGRLLRITRGPAESFALTPAVQEAYAAAKLPKGEALELRTALAGAGYPMPKTFPAYTALEVDREGNTWVRRFEIPGREELRWGIFQRDGRFLGHVILPAGVTVLEIGADYLLGLGKGSMDEEQVKLYRIRK